MHRSFLPIIVALLAAVPVPTAATYLASYATQPVEHDDLGRSDEPDFESTGVLGEVVTNKVWDPTPTTLEGAIADPQLPPPPPHPHGGERARVLAPGCTDDSGRRPSGVCGLWTVGARERFTDASVPGSTFGVQGMSGPHAPGRYGYDKAFTATILDARQTPSFYAAGPILLDGNAKLRDWGASATLAAIDGDFGRDALFGPTLYWARFGDWADRNGNGVIDHLQDGTDNLGNPVESAQNEWRWHGGCLAFDGRVRTGWHCAHIGSFAMHGYVYPGNHHASCGSAVPADVTYHSCAYVPADAPGRQVACFAELLTVQQPLVCYGTVDDLDALDEGGAGDPLLGPQSSVAPDFQYADQTGDASLALRVWVAGDGWPVHVYDPSLLVTTLTVTAFACATHEGSTVADLETCMFTDVDRHTTWFPEVEGILAGQVKPAARAHWVAVRDTWSPLEHGLSPARLLDRPQEAPSSDAGGGNLNDQLADPGWSREPNTPGDQYPGAVWGGVPGAASDAAHHGWTNNYDRYKQGWHAWTDLQAVRNLHYGRMVGLFDAASCVVCAAGGTLEMPPVSPLVRGDIREPGRHDRTLEAGGYYFTGAVGLWKDRAFPMREEYVDPLDVATLVNDVAALRTPTRKVIAYDISPDGWIGNLVETLGAYRYRGYAPERCTTENGPGLYEYALCHPYLNGAIDGGYGSNVAVPAIKTGADRLPTLPRFPSVEPPSLEVPEFDPGPLLGFVQQTAQTSAETALRVANYAHGQVEAQRRTLPCPAGPCPPPPPPARTGDPPPQAEGDSSHGEWRGRCRSDLLGDIILRPESGTWTQPTFVWEGHESTSLLGYDSPANLGAVLHDLTGTSRPIIMDAACRGGATDGSGAYVGTSYVIFPMGIDTRVTVAFSAQVPLDAGGHERVVDTDVYEPSILPLPVGVP